jgi:hypothetical protein
MGDKISFGNVSGSIVTIGSMLEHLTQTVGSANNIDENGKKRLVALIEQLQMELQKLPPEKKEEAEAIADSAKTFVEAGTRAQPNKIILKTTSEGLKSAARNIGGVLPTVLTIATAIVKTVLELRGIHLP